VLLLWWLWHAHGRQAPLEGRLLLLTKLLSRLLHMHLLI
jgi:hypothetical protein